MSPAAALQNANSAAAAGGSTLRNMSDSRFPRGITDTPPTPAPGLNGTTATAPAPANVPGAATTTPAATTPSASAPVRTR